MILKQLKIEEIDFSSSTQNSVVWHLVVIQS